MTKPYNDKLMPKRFQDKRERDSTKGGLVQFRADEELMIHLSEVAQRLNVPVGTLARIWVWERLQQELVHNANCVTDWVDSRYQEIGKELDLYDRIEDGPVQIIHLMPMRRNTDLEPEDIRRLSGMLPPVERVDDYSAKINLHGFRTSKTFRSETRESGHVQVYRTGQLESVRVLPHDEKGKVLYLGKIEEDLIRAVWSYSCAMLSLQVAPPVSLVIGFKRMAGFRMRSAFFFDDSDQIEIDEFRLPPISLLKWEGVVQIERTAQILKDSLNQLCNAAGFARSPSFLEDGSWRGLDSGHAAAPKGSHPRKALRSTEEIVVQLSGMNRMNDRVDIILHRGETTYLLGKVRFPYIEPSELTIYSCLVFQDEMSDMSKTLLQRLASTDEVNEFEIGKYRVKGTVSRVFEGFGAGAFDGINIPDERTLSFWIEPSRK